MNSPVAIPEGLLNRPELYRILHRFNFFPSLDWHSSWRSAFPFSQLPDETLACIQAHRRISRYWLERLGLADSLCFDLGEPLLQVATLPRERLAHLALFMGLLAYAGSVRRLVEREAVSRCREALGEDAWLFLRRRSSLLAREINGREEDAFEPEGLAGQASIVGYDLLRVAFLDTPEPLRQRVLLKMPMADEKRQYDPAQSLASKNLALRVCREVEPEWCRCFL